MRFRCSLLIALVFVITLQANAELTRVAKDFINQTKTFAATKVMASPTANGSYLMCLWFNQPSGSTGNLVATLKWTDEQGAHSRNLALSGSVPQSSVFPIRVLAKSAVTVQTSGTVGASYDLFVRGIGFWVPGSGSTSLSDYHTNLLLWSNATYPNKQTVLTAPAADTSYLLRVNINEPANTSNDSMCVDIVSVDEYSRKQTQTACASDDGSPAMMTFPVRVKGGTSVQLVTYHFTPPKWGGSPTYNLTVDVIGF